MAQHRRLRPLREAEALARLDHPAIRHVYDAGETGEVAYRIGNWIDGEGLHEAVARGPRPIPDVAPVTTAIFPVRLLTAGAPT